MNRIKENNRGSRNREVIQTRQSQNSYEERKGTHLDKAEKLTGGPKKKVKIKKDKKTEAEQPKTRTVGSRQTQTTYHEENRRKVMDKVERKKEKPYTPWGGGAGILAMASGISRAKSFGFLLHAPSVRP